MSVANYPNSPVLYTQTTVGPVAVAENLAAPDVRTPVGSVFAFNDLQGYDLDIFCRGTVTFDPGVTRVNKFQLAVCRTDVAGNFSSIVTAATISNSTVGAVALPAFTLTTSKGSNLVPELGANYYRVFAITSQLVGGPAPLSNVELSIVKQSTIGYVPVIPVP